MQNIEEFNALAQKYQDAIFRLAITYLKSYENADDVTQEVLIALYRSDMEFASEQHAKNWLMKVTVNECKRLWRRPWMKHESLDDYVRELPCEMEEDRALLSAIMRLDMKKRVAVILHYLEGYSLKEIAEIQNVPAATVGTWLSRARTELKRYLEE